VIADQLVLLASQVLELEAEVAGYRERDRFTLEALTRMALSILDEASVASPCKRHYFTKRVDDIKVFQLMLGADINTVVG
jgi:hypothetical protein